MLKDYASTNTTELWNTTRLQAYLNNVGSPFDSGPGICNCETLTPEVLGGEGTVYNTPATDPAPWYDVDYDHSGEFLGFLPLTVSGLDDNPRARNVTNAVGGGGIFSRSQDLPRTITVTGVILGSTCCGVEYGLHYLSEALSECVGGGCDGSCLIMYSCCPDEDMTADQFNQKYRRTYRRTALVSGPTVTGRSATGGGSCSSGGCSGADLLEVEFVIVAGTPWAWTDPVPALDVDLPIAGDPAGGCVEWCLDANGITCGGEVCLHQECDDSDACLDPLNPVLQPPKPTQPASSFCVSLAPERACYEVDLTDRPKWSSDVPIIRIYSGTAEMRNFRVAFYEMPVDAVSCADYVDGVLCDPANEYIVTYMPPRSYVNIDGQTGQATADCIVDCGPATTVFGDRDGGPLKVNPMSCSRYCVCLEVDNATGIGNDAGASISIEFSGRGL